MINRTYNKEMPYKNVGNSGLLLSFLGLGTWLNFNSYERARILVEQSRNGGVCYFDTADMYGQLPGWAESFLGEALQGHRRSSYVVSSKVYSRVGRWPNDSGLSRKHIIESCDASLSRLKLDYMDLYYCHRYDPNTPLEETADAMSYLVQQGKILYIGISMWPPEKILEFSNLAKSRGIQVVANQVLYNVIQRPSKEVLRVCEQEGIGLVAFSPLAQGALTGKYLDGLKDEYRKNIASRNKWINRIYTDHQLISKLNEFFKICNDFKISYIQAAFGWLYKQKHICCALAGFRNEEQLADITKLAPYSIPEEMSIQMDSLFLDEE